MRMAYFIGWILGIISALFAWWGLATTLPADRRSAWQMAVLVSVSSLLGGLQYFIGWALGVFSVILFAILALFPWIRDYLEDIFDDRSSGDV